MLRLLATPVTSAFFPSSKPMTHLRDAAIIACRASRVHDPAARIVQRNQPTSGEIGATDVEQHVLRIARVLFAVVLEVPEAGLLVRADRRDVRARRTDDTVRDAVAVEGRGEEGADQRGAVALANEVGVGDEEVER